MLTVYTAVNVSISNFLSIYLSFTVAVVVAPLLVIAGAVEVVVVVLVTAAVTWERLHLKVMDHPTQEVLKRYVPVKRNSHLDATHHFWLFMRFSSGFLGN